MDSVGGIRGEKRKHPSGDRSETHGSEIKRVRQNEGMIPPSQLFSRLQEMWKQAYGKDVYSLFCLRSRNISGSNKGPRVDEIRQYLIKFVRAVTVTSANRDFLGIFPASPLSAYFDLQRIQTWVKTFSPEDQIKYLFLALRYKRQDIAKTIVSRDDFMTKECSDSLLRQYLFPFMKYVLGEICFTSSNEVKIIPLSINCLRQCFSYSIKYGFVEIAQEIFKYCEFSEVDKKRLIKKAALEGQPEILKIIAQGEDNLQWETIALLIQKVKEGRVERAEIEDVLNDNHFSDNRLKTDMMIAMLVKAAQFGNREMVKYVLNCTALSKVTTSHFIALFQAKKNHNQEIVDIIDSYIDKNIDSGSLLQIFKDLITTHPEKILRLTKYKVFLKITAVDLASILSQALSKEGCEKVALKITNHPNFSQIPSSELLSCLNSIFSNIRWWDYNKEKEKQQLFQSIIYHPNFQKCDNIDGLEEVLLSAIGHSEEAVVGTIITLLSAKNLVKEIDTRQMIEIVEACLESSSEIRKIMSYFLADVEILFGDKIENLLTKIKSGQPLFPEDRKHLEEVLESLQLVMEEKFDSV